MTQSSVPHTNTQQCKEGKAKDKKKRATEQVNTAGNEEGSFSGVVERTILWLVVSTSTILSEGLMYN